MTWVGTACFYLQARREGPMAEKEPPKPPLVDACLLVQTLSMLNCRTLQELDVFASKLKRDVERNPGEYTEECLDILRSLYTAFRQYMHTGGRSDA